VISVTSNNNPIATGIIMVPKLRIAVIPTFLESLNSFGSPLLKTLPASFPKPKLQYVPI